MRDGLNLSLHACDCKCSSYFVTLPPNRDIFSSETPNVSYRWPIRRAYAFAKEKKNIENCLKRFFLMSFFITMVSDGSLLISCFEALAA